MNRVCVSILAGLVAACAAERAPTPAVPTASTPAATATAAATHAPVASPTPAPGLPSFAADEPLVLVTQVTGAGGGIFVMRPDGSGLTQLATDVLPGVHKRGDWSPDGQRVVFIDETSGRMWIAHLDGTATEPVEACDEPGCDFPSWSPDGARIAFSRAESGPVGPAAVGIYVVELATGIVSQVVRLERPLLADAPRWSPDGTEIVFQVDRMDDDAYETGAAVGVVAVAGGEPRYLTEFDSFASTPDWGWITNEIVFSESLREYQREPATGDDTWDLFGIQPDGSGLRQITDMPDGSRLVAARWTPDGTRIASKQFDDTAGGGRFVDPTTGKVEAFITDAMFSLPVLRP